MKGYFGGKEIIQVVLGGATLYKKSSEVELPPPETLIVKVNTFLKGFLSYKTVPPTESYTYNANSSMTDWIEVRPNSSYRINTYLTNECVIQVKNSEGVITALTEFEGTPNVNNIVFNTGDNIYVRIYFYFGSNTRSHRDLFLTEQRD